ncbi:MAG: homoserine kinase type [Candidatus Binatota bacterium]|nr:homoserine kinase type [Candidatus Binatota bacterium]
MAVYTLIDRKELEDIIADYALGKLVLNGDSGSSALESHYLLDTSKGHYLLKIEEVKSELEVKREIDLLLFLKKHGFPCPHPIADRKGRHYRELGGRCVSLYKHVGGDSPVAEDLTLSQLENVGRVLADLHLIGKGYKKGIDNRFSFERVWELYRDVREKLPSYFRKIIRTLDEEMDYLRFYLEGKLPKGIIHGDLFPDHVLFRGEKIVGILDFEASCRGKFVFDLATAVNALCFAQGGYQLRRFEALIAGYESLRTLSLAEWDAFPNELRFSALRFTVCRMKDFYLRPPEDPSRMGKDFNEFYNRLRILRREEDGGMDGLLMAMATGYDYRKYQKVKAFEKKSK